MIPDEPRTKIERQADFFIGLLVGCGIVFLGWVSIVTSSMRESLIGSWMLILAPLVVLGCGYANYRLGARLWSRTE